MCNPVSVTFVLVGLWKLHLLTTLIVFNACAGVLLCLFVLQSPSFKTRASISPASNCLSGKHRGFGFVEFEEEDDATQAIDNMHESELYGRVITVNLARTPARKPGESSRAVWSDDAFLRQRIAEESAAPVVMTDADLELVSWECVF